jgi:hypothetical protein
MMRVCSTHVQNNEIITFFFIGLTLRCFEIVLFQKPVVVVDSYQLITCL